MSEADALAMVAGAVRREAALKQAIIATLSEFRDRFPESTVAAWIASGRLFLIPRMIPWEDVFALPSPVAKAEPAYHGDALRDQIVRAMAAASETAGVPAASFTVVNPRAVQAAQQMTNDLIVAQRRAAQESIKRTIVRAVRGKLTPQQAASLIRNTIGLDGRRANALANYAAQLIEVNDGGLARSALNRTGFKAPKTTRGMDTAVERYSKRLLADQADTIARTEIMRASNRGLSLNWERAAADGLIVPSHASRQWLVTPDDRLCFPAGVLVSTSRGPVPIEDVRVGDLVTTHTGALRAVTATMARPYTGTMTTIEAAGRKVTATSDHPFLTGASWTPAGSLRVGGQVIGHRRLDERDHAVGDVAVQPIVGDPDHGVPGGRDLGVLRRVAVSGTSVPVRAVDLQRNPADHEVDGPAHPGHLGLLLEHDPESVEDQPHVAFGHRLTLEPAVAPEGAEPAGRVAGPGVEGAPAVVAGDQSLRSSAFLGAVPPDVAPLAGEHLAARGALRVLGTDAPALDRADREPVGDDGRDGERLVADRAHLGDLVASDAIQVARPAAELPVPLRCGERRPTLLARQFHSLIVTRTSDTQAEGVTVYDLTVEGDHSFVANGFVVHNCDLCAPMNGATVPFADPFVSNSKGTSMDTLVDLPAVTLSEPPLHPRCRCTLILLA